MRHSPTRAGSLRMAAASTYQQGRVQLHLNGLTNAPRVHSLGHVPTDEGGGAHAPYRNPVQAGSPSRVRRRRPRPGIGTGRPRVAARQPAAAVAAAAAPTAAAAAAVHGATATAT